MFLDVNGVRLHTLVFGEGPRTFLAVGGWTGSWEVWEEPLAQLSAAGWRCIAYDHRGSGESPVDAAQISVELMIDDVVGVLNKLGVERSVVAGESQGGAIVQYVAVRHPERVEGLVLSAPVETGRRKTNTPFAELCRSDYPTAVRGFVERSVPEPGCEHIKRWGRNILLRADPEQAVRILEMWDDDAVPDLDPRGIAAPTLIVHGTEDAIASVASSRLLRESIPDAELLELPGVGHVPTMTRPDEVVAAIRRRFG